MKRINSIFIDLRNAEQVNWWLTKTGSKVKVRSFTNIVDAIDSVTSGYERPSHGYYAGQVLKYIWRAPFKGHYLQDLEKAQWYLNRLVKKVQDEVE